MKHLKYLFLLPIVMILSGCWDSEENARMGYVHGIGVDYKDGELKIHVQLISFINVARSETQNPDVVQSEVGFTSGRTINEAFGKLYRSVDEKLFLGHLSYLVFTEELLKEPGKLSEVLNALTRFIDIRYQTWVYATDEPLEQFFIESPILRKPITLTKLANPLNSYEQDSFIEPLDMRELIIQFNEPNHLARIPYVSMRENWQTEQGPGSSVHIIGMALVTPKEFKGIIKLDDAKGFQWMSKKTIKSRFTTESNGYDLSVQISKVKPKVIPVVKGNDVKFRIEISNVALVLGYRVTSEKEVQEAVEQTLKKEILETYRKGLELNCDVFRLSEALYRKKVDVWKKLEKDGVIPLTEDSIEEIKINVLKVNAGRSLYKNSIRDAE